MRTAYLDHNQWIQLARAYHGRVDDEPLHRALKTLQAATETGELVIPLSAIHYIEAARKANTPARTRLGIVMWQLSRGWTMASYHSILTSEIEAALAARLPQVRPRPFTLVSHGVAHAFGMEPLPYRIPPQVRSRVSEQHAQHLEAMGSAIIDRVLVTGELPPGETVPRFGITEHNRRFQHYLRDLRPRVSQLPRAKWEDAIYAISTVDILDVLNEIMAHHDLYAHQVATTKEDFRALVDALPSRRVDIQLHKQVLLNPRLQPKENDLEDWAGLAPAAAHCDFLVCEKHFANLVLRNGFAPKATVLTDIRALPKALGCDAAA